MGDYDEMHKDYSESIDALERAIAVLKKQAFTRKQESLVQISAVAKLTLIPEEAKKTINAFLQQDPDEGLAVSAPEAAGYEFQSQGVIEMLEKLLDKFIEERTVLEKEEMNSKQAFEMLIQDLTAQIDQAKQDRTEKAETKAKKLLRNTLQIWWRHANKKQQILSPGNNCAQRNLRQLQKRLRLFPVAQ